MAENQEQIESRLCGYVDDTLDPTERAEIEAHLAAHPQHRQLLIQLRKMRDALAALPRESAPAELGESFSGQLERSVLLDGLGEQPAPARMRIGRLPQLAAAAAILLLVSGLGMMVYFTFLRMPQQIAQNTHSPVGPLAAPSVSLNSDKLIATKPGEPLASAGPLIQSMEHGVATEIPKGGTGGSQAPGALPPSPVADAMRAAQNPLDLNDADKNDAAFASEKLATIAGSVLTNQQVQSLLGHADRASAPGGASRPIVVMVVSTATPDATNRRVGNYLQTNNADWQPAPSADGLARNEEQAFGGGPAPKIGGGVNETTADGAHHELPAAPAATAGPAGGDQVQPTTRPQTQQDALANAGQPNLRLQPPGTLGSQGATHTGTLDDKAAKMATNALNHLHNQITELESNNLNSRCYVVHNLSFQQAAQLSDSLRQSGGNTQAPLFADAVATASDFDLYRQMREPKANADGQELSPSTAPATQPLRDQPAYSGQAPHVGKDHSDDIPNDRLTKGFPQTSPATNSAVVPINRQAILGSSPVDLVILIKEAPAEAPTTLPATAPATQPTSEPAE